jgi:hypothetical protein
LEKELISEWQTNYFDYKWAKRILSTLRHSTHDGQSNPFSPTLVSNPRRKSPGRKRATTHTGSRHDIGSIVSPTAPGRRRGAHPESDSENSFPLVELSSQNPRALKKAGIERHVESRQQVFFNFLDSELEKVDEFYKEKEIESVDKLTSLQGQLNLLLSAEAEDLKSHRRSFDSMQSRLLALGTSSGQVESDSPIPLKEAKKKLKIAFQELYRGLDLLSSYADLNYTAFSKINKKYDKVMHTPLLHRLKYRTTVVDHSYFVRSHLVNEYKRAVEDLYTRYFERGIRKPALKSLRAATARSRQGSQFGSLIRSGLMLIAGLLLGIEGSYFAARTVAGDDPVLALQTRYLLQVCHPPNRRRAAI